MHAASDPLPPLRDVISEFGLRAKKSLGQHFLFDLNLTRKIARAAGPLAHSTMYEVGSGPGGLTRALLCEGAMRVIAVERDQRCLPALEQISLAWPGRLEIIAADAMKLDENSMLRERNFVRSVRVAANLPYNMATALLVKWLTTSDWPPFWESLTLMFQHEVAQRITSKPGAQNYGRLSVLAQWRTRPSTLFDVDRRAFTPTPAVTSTLVRLEPLDAPVAAAQLRDLERVTAAAFGQRRKMLRQSLKQLSSDAETIMQAAGINPQSRPQELTVEEFAALARAFSSGA